LIFIVPS